MFMNALHVLLKYVICFKMILGEYSPYPLRKLAHVIHRNFFSKEKKI